MTQPTEPGVWNTTKKGRQRERYWSSCTQENLQQNLHLKNLLQNQQDPVKTNVWNSKKKIHSMPKFRTRQESPSETKLEMRFYWNQSLSWNRFFVFQPSKKRLWARKTSSRVPSFSKRKNRLGRGGNNTKPWLSFFGWIQQKFRSSWWLMISKKEEVINGKLDTTNELLISCRAVG